MKIQFSQFVLILLLCFTSFGFAQQFDFSSLQSYWKLTESLKTGDSLSAEKWAQFLEEKPNKLYVNNQGFNANYLERLRKTIEYVYMPKHASLLEKRVEEMKNDMAAYWMT
jgi:hypothetical protein